MDVAKRNEQIFHQFLELTNDGMGYKDALEELAETPYGEGYDRMMLSVGALKKIIHDKRKEAEDERHKKAS